MTQNIERMWREVKKNVQKYGKKKGYPHHFERIQFIFRFKSREECNHAFWKQFAK